MPFFRDGLLIKHSQFSIAVHKYTFLIILENTHDDLGVTLDLPLSLSFPSRTVKDDISIFRPSQINHTDLAELAKKTLSATFVFLWSALNSEHVCRNCGYRKLTANSIKSTGGDHRNNIDHRTVDTLSSCHRSEFVN